jgi:FixJ family two-component response regulator
MAKAGLKVLVVEDDVGLGEAMQRLLGAAGIDARLYSSAEALLANGAAANADCVISDWRLPALSGLDLLDAIHDRGWRPPLILITAHDAPGLREEATRRGATFYLAKPFRGTALLDAIAAVTNDTSDRSVSSPETAP